MTAADAGFQAPATQAELDAMLAAATAAAVPSDYDALKAQAKAAADAGKSELELANERVAELTAQADALRRDAERAAVAADPRFGGVPAALLVGSTKAELEASAAALIAWRGEKSAETPGPWRTQGDPAQSGTSHTPDGEGKESWARSFFGV
ncbi:hypothetical protein ACFWGP_05390 [Agromyces sp. NPDC127015]|uniref:hypothetical protein n=1 Tax=Agromyces sp. NPDC127015 TaxID=3347108 RepID=UPI003669638A